MHADNTPCMASILVPQAPARTEPCLQRGHLNMTGFKTLCFWPVRHILEDAKHLHSVLKAVKA